MTHGDYVLIVEDVLDEREAARLTLEIEGYEVVALSTGDEALAYMRAAPVPSLILLDLKMHGTTGWGFRTEQLDDPRLASIPVLVCSGDGRLSEKAQALGIEGQLQKPIDQRALLALVARHCRKNAAPPPVG